MNRSTILVAVLAGALALPAWAQQPALSDLLVHPSKMVFPDLSFKVPRAKRLVAKKPAA
ncbi:MAG: hypothetical protein HY815_11170 [Candidatus Riflebacteria bacterium]|nr:hypothetical protein [Candidatus Riflebacteria bacterium]